MIIPFDRRILTAVSITSALLLTACIDDNYDLSHIDDTIGIEVRDLVLPLNLAPVTFSSVVNLEDEDDVEVNNNGEYVIRKTGDFDEVVNIKPFRAYPMLDNPSLQLEIPAGAGVFTIPAQIFSYEYADEGSSSIKTLERGDVTFDMSVRFAMHDKRTGAILKTPLRDVALRIPTGLYGHYTSQGETKYITPDTADPVAMFAGDATPDTDGTYTFTYHVTSIDAAKAGLEYTPEYFSYRGRLGLESASIGGVATGAALVDISLHLTEFVAHSVTGVMSYDFRDFDRQHVDLGNMPDVLTDPETNIVLHNPQIYLQLNNPLYNYGFTGSSGLSIMQTRPEGELTASATLDGRLQLDASEVPQRFLFSPNPQSVTPVAGYEHAVRYAMTNLEYILSGRGLPTGLDIDFISPMLNQHHVTDLPLGVDLGTIYGDYMFYAPLSFAEGSQVFYTGVSDDWGLDDDQDIEIDQLTITAHLQSDLPVRLQLTAYPLDHDGRVITSDGRDVSVTVDPAMIPARANQNITITMNGRIRHLDGIRYKAYLVAGEDAETLRPDMNLNLTDIRIKVTGRYINKSND